jgi:hypothetical protein
MFLIWSIYWVTYGRYRLAPLPVIEASASSDASDAAQPLDELFSMYSSFRQAFNSKTKGAVSNGLICAVGIFPVKSEPGTLSHAAIYVANLRTNKASPCIQLPPEALFKIKLFDSNGVAVKRTAAGEKYVDWTDKQCVDWYLDVCAKKLGHGSFMVLPPPDCYTQVGWINLQQLFELRQPGDYTFHVSLPVLELKMNAAGQHDHFEKTMLPEAVVKVHFLPEDIKASQEFRKSQTNAPSKAQ